MKKLLLLAVVLINMQIHAQCWQTVSTEWQHTAAIKTDGTLWTWGDNWNGALGDGTSIDKHIPTHIGTSINWQSVSTGFAYCVAIKTD